MIEEFARLIPEDLRGRSGSVFYSGRRAFSRPSPLYILGLNPGGDVDGQRSETVEWHTRKVLFELPALWSAYRDESWRGAPPGTRGMQPRVLHLLERVGLSPDEVPASNIVFSRSSRERTFKGRVNKVAEACWSFHQSVIASLKPKVILCFGRTAASFVCDRLKAHSLVDEFVEENARRWRSRTFVNAHGTSVISAAHPSIADWTCSATDPSRLVVRALAATRPLCGRALTIDGPGVATLSFGRAATKP